MEIGSEFWWEEGEKNNCNFFSNLGIDSVLLFSGRTAIDYVLEDIMQKKNIRTAYLPAYCCMSMLQPFLERNIKVEFYSVIYDKESKKLRYGIDVNKQSDIFFAMSYFGYQSTIMDSWIKKWKEKEDTIIIEDITHRLLSENPVSKYSDYAIASLRKWFPVISGGIAVNRNDVFQNSIFLKNPNEDKIKIKKEAMEEKRDYIFKYKDRNKEGFLKKYEIFNESLSKEYRDLLIDKISRKLLFTFNIEEIKIRRIQNGQILQKELKDIPQVQLLCANIEKGDCPLFIPVFIEDEGSVQELREFFIKNNIYIPSHWKKPFLISQDLCNIYGRELSLICDQRYSIKEMNEYIEKIKLFFKEKIN